MLAHPPQHERAQICVAAGTVGRGPAGLMVGSGGAAAAAAAAAPSGSVDPAIAKCGTAVGTAGGGGGAAGDGSAAGGGGAACGGDLAAAAASAEAVAELSSDSPS